MCYLKYALDIKALTSENNKDTDHPEWIQVSPIDEFSITSDEDGELFISGRIGGKFSFAPDTIPFEEIPNEPLSYHDSSFNLFSVRGTDTVNWFLSEMDHKNIIDITHVDPEKCCVVDHCGNTISRKLSQ